MNFKYFPLILLLIVCSACQQDKSKNELSTESLQENKIIEAANDSIYKSDNLIIVKLSQHCYQHISYLNTNDFGRVACNGMLVVNDKEAILFDTPTDNIGSTELIDFVQQKLNLKIKAIVPTHFHNDCIGGSVAFEKLKIPIYASSQTIQLIKKEGKLNPENFKSFKDSLTLSVGEENVFVKYLGPGHTKDNVVGYFPKDEILFGGCLIKESGATKGYLGDADTLAWPKTVKLVKENYPLAKIIIPGHGKSGDRELLDYTINLFKPAP